MSINRPLKCLINKKSTLLSDLSLQKMKIINAESIRQKIKRHTPKIQSQNPKKPYQSVTKISNNSPQPAYKQLRFILPRCPLISNHALVASLAASSFTVNVLRRAVTAPLLANVWGAPTTRSTNSYEQRRNARFFREIPTPSDSQKWRLLPIRSLHWWVRLVNRRVSSRNNSWSTSRGATVESRTVRRSIVSVSRPELTVQICATATPAKIVKSSEKQIRQVRISSPEA